MLDVKILELVHWFGGVIDFWWKKAGEQKSFNPPVSFEHILITVGSKRAGHLAWVSRAWSTIYFGDSDFDEL